MTGLGLSAADHEAIAWRSARQLAALSRAFGVPVLIENVGPNPFFRRAGDYRRLLEAVPDLGFCLDFGHAHVLPGYEDVHAFTRALAPHVRCVHAYNTPRYGGRIGYHFPPCPGQSPEHGWMDLPSLLRTVVTDSAGIEFVIFEYQAGEGADAAEIKSRIRDVRGYSELGKQADVSGREWLAAKRLRWRGARVDATARIAPSACIEGEDIVIGANVVIGQRVRISGQRIVIQAFSHLADDVSIKAASVSIGYNCILFDGAQIISIGKLVLADFGKLSRHTILKAGEIDIGVEFWMNAGAEIGGGGWRSGHGSFTAGDRCHIGRNTHINVAFPVRIGSWSAVGMDCTIATHGQWRPVTRGFPRHWGPVTIGQDVVVYSRCVISPGVSIGDWATVGGGSVVTRSIPDYAFAAGVPARVMRQGAPAPSDEARLLELLDEFHQTRVPHWRRRAAAAAIEDPASADAIVYIRDWHDAPPAAAGACVYLVNDGGLVARGLELNACLFDVANRDLYGPASPVSEALREFLHTAGLRFRYHGYRRSLLSYRGLIDSGTE